VRANYRSILVRGNYRGAAGASAQKLPTSSQGRAILKVFAWRASRFSLWSTMIRLHPGQRRVLVSHLPELANVAAGSLLFGQFLSERSYSPGLAL